MFSRKKYQEKYLQNIIRREDEIKSLNDEVKEVCSLFEELDNEINEQKKELITVADIIEENKQKTQEISNNLLDANRFQQTINKYKLITGTIIGASIGSIMYIYNPYIAIGTIIGGGFSGGIITTITDYINSKDNEDNK